ncbi:MAG: DUF1836 domain-containing protein [Erysipelotrichaceae bacterium]|nr:DUF1836 domain-containing protein [Erysipelotrichaceae bacterium]
MKKKEKEIIEFHLPTYKEIPAVGLYLDQTSKYINECMSDLDGMEITNSMISNYVKKHLIANPVKKQYGREQIAYLIFIVMTKSSLSLDDVEDLFDLQKKKYSCEETYTYFRDLFEEIYYGEDLRSVKKEDGDKGLLKDIVINVVSNIRLHKLLSDTFRK